MLGGPVPSSSALLERRASWVRHGCCGVVWARLWRLQPAPVPLWACGHVYTCTCKYVRLHEVRL